MDTETCGIRKGAIACKGRPPLDVRLVAYLLYFVGFLQLAISLLMATSVVRSADDASRRVLLGAVMLAGSGAWAIYMSCMSACNLFSAWGLMRRIRFTWWFALAYLTYNATDGAFVYAKYPVTAGIGIAMCVAGIVWLWFRRELYGVHLVASHTKRNEESRDWFK